MSTIYLRRAKLADLNTIMEIIEEARKALKNAGNPQWQDGHPDRTMINRDISQEISWVLIVNNQLSNLLLSLHTGILVTASGAILMLHTPQFIGSLFPVAIAVKALLSFFLAI